MHIENEIKYDFSDVLIKPKRSYYTSRKEVDLESLRSTLGDIMPKSKGRGIMKEGEEINL